MPEFDEIIFENRNKSYGAYLLRKSYKSVASLSVLCGTIIFALLVFLLTMNSGETIASSGPGEGVILLSDPVQPDFSVPETPKIPVSLQNLAKNLQPVVTDDTTDFSSSLPTFEELLKEENPAVTDTSSIYTQTEADQIIPSDEPLISVQQMPEFPGGESELLRFVAENTMYPDEAIQNNIQGKVFVKFAVNKDGSVNRIEVIKGVDPLLDNEAMRVVASLPRFRPGMQNGEPVAVWFNIPVFFRIKN